MSTKTKFFPTTNEADAWNVFTQSRTGRMSAAALFRDSGLMSSLPQAERLRIARLAAYRGAKDAAAWWAANATRPADRAEARKYAA